MADRTARQVFDAYLEAMNAADLVAVADLMHPDYVEDYPQSGERVRGREHAIAIRRNYPELDLAGQVEGQPLVVGGEEAWALAPNLTAIRVTSAGETLTAVMRARYPDGPWYIVYICTVENGRLRRATLIFGPLFEPPDWRREWVGRMPPQER